MCRWKTVILFLLLPALVKAELISNMKMIGILTSQLKELKEVLEVQKLSLEKLEEFNKRVQTKRLQILRVKNLVNSAKMMARRKNQGLAGGISFLRRAKSIGKEGIGIGNELVTELTEEEADKLAKELDKIDGDARSLEDRIQLIKNERAKSIAKTGATVMEHDIKVHSALSSSVEEMANVSFEDLELQRSSSYTAKNTSMTNQILIEDSKVQVRNLEIQQEILDQLKKNELNELKKDNETLKFWGVKK